MNQLTAAKPSRTTTGSRRALDVGCWMLGVFSTPCRLAVGLAMLLSCVVIHAQDSSARPQPPQPNRVLLIFETSPGMKKNLPVVRQMLGSLFASNIQGELKSGDDLAVWTVDSTLHTGAVPMESWTSDEAEDYATRLNEFLEHQKYHRNASLAAMQPLLDHVAKSSDHLTVLIFCDSESRLTGTPYDSGANDIITNAAARLKGKEAAFIVVLRAYHGEYLGCSVNRSGLLNFPKFPAPPAPPPPPAPAPVVKQTPSPAPEPAPGPVVKPIPALVIVGTHASTNVSALATLPPPQPPVTTPASVSTKPAPAVIPQPAPPVALVTPASVTPQPNPAPPPANMPTPTTPASVQPPPVSSPATENSSPASPAAASSSATSTTPAASGESTTSATVAAGTGTGPDTGVLVPLIIAGGAILVAIGIVAWLVLRNRRPEGSLISSSMQDDPRLPPRR